MAHLDGYRRMRFLKTVKCAIFRVHFSEFLSSVGGAGWAQRLLS